VLVAHGLSAIALGLPWPALLVAVWEHGHSEMWLGVTGAARMAPYVVLSWLAGRVADRVSRGRLVRVSLVTRVMGLVATAALLDGGHLAAAVACACLTVALGTPAYPAIAAAMPRLAGQANDQATSLLVTCEVGAFVVGPAVGGLLLGWGSAALGCWAAAALTAMSLVAIRGVAWAQPARRSTTVQQRALGHDERVEMFSQPTAPGDGRVAVWSLLRRRPAALTAVAGVAAVNAIDSAVAIALLPLAEQAWHANKSQFGLATAAVGVGALAAPLMQRAWGLGVDAWRRSALALCVPLVAVAVVSGLWWAIVPLTLLGTASVHLEAVATSVIQRAVPDEVRSSVLGLADSVMVAAAAGAALVAPFAVGMVGPRGLIALCAAAGLGLLAVAKGWRLGADALDSERVVLVAAPGLASP
jgi:MFS family permease